MSDLLDEFNQIASSFSGEIEDAVYSDRKERERIDELEANLAEHERRSRDQEITLQGRYESSKQVVSLLFTLDAYGVLGDRSEADAIATCKELHRQLELRKESDVISRPAT